MSENINDLRKSVSLKAIPYSTISYSFNAQQLKRYTIFKKFISIFLSYILTLLLLQSLIFTLIELAPTDASEAIYTSMGYSADSQTLEATKLAMGLNKDYKERYLDYMYNLLNLNLGYSFIFKDDLNTVLKARFLLTLKLSLISITFALSFAILLAIMANLYQGLIKKLILSFSYIGIAIPNFYLALFIIYLVTIQFNLNTFILNTENLNFILACLCLGLAICAYYTRFIYALIAYEYEKNYVKAMQLRALHPMYIMFKHCLINISPELLSLIALTFVHILSGSAIIESIFSLQGLGSYALLAIKLRDSNAILAYTFLCVTLYFFINKFTLSLSLYLQTKYRKSHVN